LEIHGAFSLSPCLPISLSPCLPISLSPCLPISQSPPLPLSPYLPCLRHRIDQQQPAEPFDGLGAGVLFEEIKPDGLTGSDAGNTQRSRTTHDVLSSRGMVAAHFDTDCHRKVLSRDRLLVIVKASSEGIARLLLTVPPVATFAPSELSDAL